MEADKAANPGTFSARGEMPAHRTPWYRRVGFWRAAAGMALALVLACAAVVFEFASEMSHRSSHYRLHIAQLYDRIDRMRGKIVTADRRLAGMRSEVAAREDLNRILASPDTQLMRLASSDNHSAGTSGLIAVSKSLRSAVVEVAGLPPLPRGQTYAVSWMLKHGGTARAAQFQTDVEGRGSAIVKLPPREGVIVGTIVTVESEESADRPIASVKLRSVTLKAETTR
jgi:hypothetical protein